eukprot:CAMPEP_0185580756 /NCGR_PEP_ID=MMETSP0434-20130131/17681_1 /TAXON_ID=626734 ORGANISM="Favella taraikaensis, Strain Fe Narragansett Bay" /NCGR_SAMPLE_ID=MMETSP0434 /ASSEMBLY_ACC=CAM_ASM_000379 /LENGTH=170 /DNA_ID=CAMNT_0028199115 /DNA_START=56 /DNA_END=568 /DNA_ORIENTATION=-
MALFAADAQTVTLRGEDASPEFENVLAQVSAGATHSVPKHLTETMHPHAKALAREAPLAVADFEKTFAELKKKDAEQSEALMKQVEGLRTENKEFYDSWTKNYKTAQDYMKRATSKNPKVVAKYEKFTQDYYCKHPELRVQVQPVQVMDPTAQAAQAAAPAAPAAPEPAK